MLGIFFTYRLAQPCLISHTRYLHVSHISSMKSVSSLSKTCLTKTFHNHVAQSVKMLHISVKLLHIILKNIPFQSISLAYRLIAVPIILALSSFLFQQNSDRQVKWPYSQGQHPTIPHCGSEFLDEGRPLKGCGVGPGEDRDEGWGRRCPSQRGKVSKID